MKKSLQASRVMHSHVFLQFLLFSLSAFSALAVPDGLWNGKRTPADKLKERIEKKDPEAMAEWADCSRNGFPEISYDEKVVFKFAKKAADLGNPYGMAILARCYLVGMGTEKNAVKGLALAQKSADAGHPLGIKNLGNYHLQGAGGLPKSPAKYAEFTSKAADLGCLMAKGNRAHGRFDGINGFIENRDASMEELVETVRMSETSYPSSNLLVQAMDQPKNRFLNPEIIRYAEERMRISGEAGNQESLSRLGVYLRDSGRPHEGVPLILEAAKTPHSFASEMAFGCAIGRPAAQKAGVVGQYSAVFRFARDAYKAGSRNGTIIRWVANSYIHKWEGKFYEPGRALPYAEELVEMQYPGALRTLAEILILPKARKVYDIDRGRDIFIYLSKNDRHVIHILVDSYLDNQKADRDLVKGYAATLAAADRLTGVPLKKVKRRQADVLKKLTPKQKKAGEKLFDEGFPVSDQFRIPAMKRMIKKGDLPKGTRIKRRAD